MIQVLDGYFASVFTKEDDSALVDGEYLYWIRKIDRNVLESLKHKNDLGPYGMHSPLLREAMVEIAEVLKTVFQPSL